MIECFLFFFYCCVKHLFWVDRKQNPTPVGRKSILNYISVKKKSISFVCDTISGLQFSTLSSVVLTEHYFLLLYFSPHHCHVGDLVYSVLPPISWTSAPPSPDSLFSPCSRDGSSHTEQFPISFVHAGSSEHLVRLARCTACSCPGLCIGCGELQAVQRQDAP